MHRRLIIIRAALLLGMFFVLFGAFVWNRQLEIGSQERASHFVATYFLAEEASKTVKQGSPKNIEDLLRPYGGNQSGLLKPFGDGLIYHPQGEHFTLEEPASHRVSLFQSDRLISTDQKWPRWESSGEIARKFPGQKP